MTVQLELELELDLDSEDVCVDDGSLLVGSWVGFLVGSPSPPPPPIGRISRCSCGNFHQAELIDEARNRLGGISS